MIEASEDDKMLVLDYLTSDSGVEVFADIEGKPDTHKCTMQIPTISGARQITVSAGELRKTIGHIMELARKQTAGRGRSRARSLIDRFAEEDPSAARNLAAYKVIDISPAAAQFHASYPSNKPYESKKVCPNVAPPFDGFIMESGCPPGLEELGYGACAVVVAVLPYEEPTVTIREVLSRHPKWTLVVNAITEIKDRLVWIPISLNLYVYDDGELASQPMNWVFMYQNLNSGRLNFEGDLPTASFVMDWFVAPALFAVSLMHCKGVSLRTLPTVSHHSKKVRRRRKNNPVFEHHVIEIRDRTGRIVSGEEIEGAMSRGLYIVRGHFNVYTEAAPLFGKHTGDFWIPAHVRGSIEGGIITSEHLLRVDATQKLPGTEPG